MNPTVNIAAGDKFLVAAYIVVWVIHACYMLSLVNRGKRLERERKELNRN